MASTEYFLKILALLWACMLFFIAMIGGDKQAEKDDRSSQYVLGTTLSIAVAVILYSNSSERFAIGVSSWGAPYVSYTGFVCIILGFIVQWTGVFTLRQQWSPVVIITDDHQLIITGIYKFIRHPIYAGLLLEILGFSLAVSNWLSFFIILLPNAAAMGYRIYVEEKALEQHFGNEYFAYERRTKRLIPGIF